MRLLESEGAPERRTGGATMSLVVHAAIIVGAVAATTHRPPPIRYVPEHVDVVYTAPRPAPSRPTAPTTGAPVPGPTTAGPVVVIPPPTFTPDDLPPIGVDGPGVLVPGAVVVLGAARPSEGGFGQGAGPVGGADAGGTWDAHAVEVPVVPDARNAVPSYPEMLRTAGMTGRVVAEFVVDSTGRVRPGSLVIVEATHELFATSVRRTVPGFRFTPARVQNRRVAQRVRVPFEFEMERSAR